MKYLLLVIASCAFALITLSYGIYREYYNQDDASIAILFLSIGIFANLYFYLNWHLISDKIELFNPSRQGAFMVEAVDIDGSNAFEVDGHFMFALILASGSLVGALLFSSRCIIATTPGAYGFVVVVALIAACSFQALFSYFIYMLNDIIKGNDKGNMCPALV